MSSLLEAADFEKQMVSPSSILETAAHNPGPQANAMYVSKKTLGTMGIQMNVCWDFPAAVLKHKAGPLELTLRTRYVWLSMAQAEQSALQPTNFLMQQREKACGVCTVPTAVGCYDIPGACLGVPKAGPAAQAATGSG